MGLSWQVIESLSEKYGDSFFVLDIRRFEHNYKDFLEGFRAIYPNTNLGYSYKTNYIPRICQAVKAMGGYAEVVSQMEYDLAIAIGVPPSQIIFNGPLKQKDDLEKALLAGSIVNLDGIEEVEVVESLARANPSIHIEVGLRCNFDIATGRVSRFGFDTEGSDFEKAFSVINSIGNCQIVGLHCHISTSDRSVDSYRLRTKKILELSDRYFPDAPPKYIDIGGGFFGNMPNELKSQFDCAIPTYQEYASSIATQLREKFPGNDCPQLIIEPGVAVVADVLQFVTTVVGLKYIRSRSVALVVGSIHNTKPTGSDKKPVVTLYKNETGSLQTSEVPVDIVGYTCMEHDCLYEAYSDPVSVGDFMVFENMGAYTVVFKPPFIRANPAIVAYDSILSEYTLSRRAETMNDVFCTYVISES